MAATANPIGINSKGIKITVGEEQILGLLEIPDIGGGREVIDSTSLESEIKTSIFGIPDLGELEFKFKYDNSQATSNFRKLKAMEEEENKGAPVPKTIKLEYPDGTSVSFDAVISVKMSGASVNSMLTFAMTALVQTKLVWANPAE